MKLYYSLAVSGLAASAAASCVLEDIHDQMTGEVGNYDVKETTSKSGKQMLKIQCKKPTNKVDGKFKDVKAWKKVQLAMKNKEAGTELWGRFKCSTKGEWIAFSSKYGDMGYCPNTDQWAEFEKGGYQPIAEDLGCVAESLQNKIKVSGWDIENYSFEEQADGGMKVTCAAPKDDEKMFNKNAYKLVMAAWEKAMKDKKMNKWGEFKCSQKGSWLPKFKTMDGLIMCPGSDEWKKFLVMLQESMPEMDFDALKPEKPNKDDEEDDDSASDVSDDDSASDISDDDDKPAMDQEMMEQAKENMDRLEKIMNMDFDSLTPFKQKKFVGEVVEIIQEMVMNMMKMDMDDMDMPDKDDMDMPDKDDMDKPDKDNMDQPDKDDDDNNKVLGADGPVSFDPVGNEDFGVQTVPNGNEEINEMEEKMADMMANMSDFAKNVMGALKEIVQKMKAKEDASSYMMDMIKMITSDNVSDKLMTMAMDQLMNTFDMDNMDKPDKEDKPDDDSDDESSMASDSDEESSMASDSDDDDASSMASDDDDKDMNGIYDIREFNEALEELNEMMEMDFDGMTNFKKKKFVAELVHAIYEIFESVSGYKEKMDGEDTSQWSSSASDVSDSDSASMSDFSDDEEDDKEMPDKDDMDMPDMPDKDDMDMPDMPDKDDMDMPDMPDKDDMSMPGMPDKDNMDMGAFKMEAMKEVMENMMDNMSDDNKAIVMAVKKIIMAKKCEWMMNMPDKDDMDMPDMPDKDDMDMPDMPDMDDMEMPDMPGMPDKDSMGMGMGGNKPGSKMDDDKEPMPEKDGDDKEPMPEKDGDKDMDKDMSNMTCDDPMDLMSNFLAMFVGDNDNYIQMAMDGLMDKELGDVIAANWNKPGKDDMEGSGKPDKEDMEGSGKPDKDDMDKPAKENKGYGYGWW